MNSTTTAHSRLFHLSAAAVMLAALSGCTIRAGAGRAQHQAPPPARQPVNAAPAPGAPAPQAAAQPATNANPQLLGTRSVTFRADKDTIVAAHQGTFRKLRLHVSGSPLEMYNMRVTFGDGSHYSPATRLVFAQGAWSRVIDLPGQARRVRTVEFWYRSRGARSGHANVQLFGM